VNAWQTGSGKKVWGKLNRKTGNKIVGEMVK